MIKFIFSFVLTIFSSLALSAGTCQWADNETAQEKLRYVTEKLKTEHVLEASAKVSAFCSTEDQTQYYVDGYAVWIKNSAILALTQEELSFLILQQNALVASNAIVQLAKVSMDVSELSTDIAEDKYHQAYAQLVTHSDQTAVNALVAMQIHNAIEVAEITLHKLLKESNVSGHAYKLAQQNIIERVSRM